MSFYFFFVKNKELVDRKALNVVFIEDFDLIDLILIIQMNVSMKKSLLFFFLFFSLVNIYAQNTILWEKVNGSSLIGKKAILTNSDQLHYKLNSELMAAKLSATTKVTVENSTIEITIPNTSGVLERFLVWESSNFEPELQAKYPEIRAYEGKGLDDKMAKIHFSLAPTGIQTMVLRTDKPTEYIEQNPNDKTSYVLFTSKNSATSTSRLVCGVKDQILNENSTKKTAKTAANNKVFKTFRLALSCTGEYTAYFGGTKTGALTAMNATLTRVNGIFNKDLAVKVVLIANNDAVIFTDAATDPYSDAKKGTTADTDDNDFWSKEVQSTLTSYIGEANYDIGHLFGATGGGGNAGCIGCVCVSPTASDVMGKGSAYTSPSDGVPQGDTFDVDFVVHEMGHQLGATHTFSYKKEGNGTSVEPGSGSTIMAYAGVTGDYDVQDNSDDYFAYTSIQQIQNNLSTKTCPVSTSISNNPPYVDAGADYTIPISTAFILTGTGSDPDGDSVTYNWEENDNATTTFSSNSIAYATKPNGPLFRSVAPISSPVRYVPAFTSVVQNKLTSTWESVSSIARTLNFSLTARDNAALGFAQTNSDTKVVNVVATAGPFVVTAPNTDGIGWLKGNSYAITWNVNNTNTLQGSSAINIRLSTDGGLTFPIVLASNTPNDGSETVLIPTDVPTSTACRILIEPTANIYYAVNSKPFSIGYTVTNECNSYSFGSAISIPYTNNGTFTTRTVSVPASTGTISNVNVLVNVTHTRMSDIEIQIVNPQGTIVSLFNKSCGTTNATLNLKFDDSGVALDCSKTTEQIIIPDSSLSAFNGQSAEGTWTFRVRDAVVGNFGTINSASVNICNQTYTLGTNDLETIDFSLYPNPNKGNFTVQFESTSASGVKIYVHDVLGKSVYHRTFEPTGTFNQNIQLGDVASGVYLVTVVDGERRTVKKIIVN